jgi:hypothetical protein
MHYTVNRVSHMYQRHVDALVLIYGVIIHTLAYSVQSSFGKLQSYK